MPSFVKVAATPPGQSAAGDAAVPAASTGTSAAAGERPSPLRGPRAGDVAAAAARALQACEDDSDSDGYETADDGDEPMLPPGADGGGAPSPSAGGATAKAGGGPTSRPTRGDGGSGKVSSNGTNGKPAEPVAGDGAGDGGLNGGTGDGPPPAGDPRPSKRMRGDDGDGPSTPAPAAGGGGTPGRTVPSKPGKPFRAEAKVDRAEEEAKQGSAPGEPARGGDKKEVEVIEIDDDDDDEEEETGPNGALTLRLSSERRGKPFPWAEQWAYMRSWGWVRHAAAGSPPLPAAVYVAPCAAGWTRGRLARLTSGEEGAADGPVRGRAYFVGAEEAKEHAREEMGWVDAGPPPGRRPWTEQWAAMRSNGWARHAAAGEPRLPAAVYVRPAAAWWTRAKLAANLAFCRDTATAFVGAEEAKAYARREMGWVEGTAPGPGGTADGRAAEPADPRVPIHRPASATTEAAAGSAPAGSAVPGPDPESRGEGRADRPRPGGPPPGRRPWTEQWAAMRSDGWTRHAAAGEPRLPAAVYVRPSAAGRTRSELASILALCRSTRSAFVGAEEAKAYARGEMGWVEGSAFAVTRPANPADPRVPVHRPASATTEAAAAAQTLRNARAGGTGTAAVARASTAGAQTAAAAAATQTLRNARAGGTGTAAVARPAADGSAGRDSGQRYSKRAVEARTAGDGSVLPAQRPRRNGDGSYARPAGRARDGMDWDGSLGRWVPLDPGRETQSTFYHPGSKDGAAATTGGTRRNSQEDRTSAAEAPAAGTLPPGAPAAAGCRQPRTAVQQATATVIDNNGSVNANANGGVRRKPAGPPAPSHRQPPPPPSHLIRQAMATVINDNSNADGGVRRDPPAAASHRQPPPQFTRHPQNGQRRTAAASARQKAPAPPARPAPSAESRLRERFSERRIDECSTVSQLEATRRRLLRLVGRVDVRLREARVGEALAAYAGGRSGGDVGRVGTAELLGRLERQLGGGGVPSGSDKTDEEEKEKEEEPTCCPLCLAPDPSDTVTCAVCDEGDVCPECTYRCPACGRDVCADCAVSPGGPSDGPGVLCSDCRCMNRSAPMPASLGAGGGADDTLLPARRRGQHHPHRQQHQQPRQVRYTSVLQSANVAVGVPHAYPAARFVVPLPAAGAVPLAARGPGGYAGRWMYQHLQEQLQQQHVPQPAGQPRQQQHPQAPMQAPRQSAGPPSTSLSRQPPRHVAEAIKAAGDARRSASAGKRKAPVPTLTLTWPTSDPPPPKRPAPGPSTAPPRSAAASARTSAADPNPTVTRVYSVHRFVVTSAPDGPLGMNMCLRPPSVYVTHVKPGTVASRLGVKTDDEITHPSESRGVKAMYDAFVAAAGRRPLTFEVRRPQFVQAGGEDGAGGVVKALHRFVIREEGRIGVMLNKTAKDLSVVSSVAKGSLGEFYGLMPNDVLARPGTDGKIIMGVFDEIRGVIIGGTRPVVIEVWRSVPQSSPPLCSDYDFNAEAPVPRREPDRAAPQCAVRTADAREEDPSRPPGPAESGPVDAPPPSGPEEGGAAPRVAANRPSARAPGDGAAGRRETEPRGPTRKSPSRRAKTASAARQEEEVVELLTSEDDASECPSGEDSDYTLT